MEKCGKCLYYKNKEKCGECGRLSNAMDNNPMFTPITNYARLKSMSVDDLTELINGITKVTAVKLGKDYVVNDKQFIQQWLLQEVREDDV